MSDTTTPTTPDANDSSKRALSSPFDQTESKRVRPGSTSSEASEMDTTSTVVHMSSEDLEKIGSHLTSTFEAKVSSILETTLESKVSAMVKSITDGVINGLSSKVKELESENASLKEKIANLEKRLDSAEEMQDRANQYSRRNCLRLTGVKESAEEDTDAVVLEVAKAIDANITLGDIDRSHRLGPPRPPRIPGTGASNGKPRDIIVKFVSYRSRSKLYKNKSKLRQSSFKGSFINEDLTRARSDLFYQCRLLAKNKRVYSSWTSDGVVLVKDNHNRVHRIESKHQLDDLKTKIGVSG